MTRTVVFDVGNVLVRWDPRNLYHKLFADPDAMEHFLATVCTPAWNHRADLGEPWEDLTAEAIARHPGDEKMIRAFRGRWHEMLIGSIAENVALLEGFRRAGVPNYAITNFAADTFAESQVRFPFLAGFDGVVCSGTERMGKPEPPIFHLLIERYRLDPAQCVFIDDTAPNIETARALGFRTIHYGLGIDAREAFRAHGLPVD